MSEIGSGQKRLRAIQDEFFNRLKTKTGWGRNEIMNEYKESVLAVLMRELDAPNTQTKTECNDLVVKPGKKLLVDHYTLPR